MVDMYQMNKLLFVVNWVAYTLRLRNLQIIMYNNIFNLCR